MTVTDIVPATNMAELDRLDPQARDVAMLGMLEQAHTWLAHAVETSAPARDIADFKAFVATAADAAKRLKVSKEIQVDAEVMVRRSERALGQSIRGGQERGEITKKSDNRYSVLPTVENGSYKTSPTDFATGDELSGNSAGIYAMTDDVTDDDFDAALDEAKDEGNVSRANVVRKIKAPGESTYSEQHAAKWDRIATLAASGSSTPQIAREVGMSEGGVKAGAKDRGIDIRADRILGNVRRLDMRRVIEQTVLELESIAKTTNNLVSVEGIRAADIEAEEIQTWVDSLNQSLKALRTVTNQIAKAINQNKESNS